MIHDHEWDEKLSAYIDHDLSAAEAAAVAQHVHACVSCRLAIEDLRSVKSALADENDAGITPREGWSALREDIAAITRRTRLIWWSAAAAAAVMISSTGAVLAHRASKNDVASVNVPTLSASITSASAELERDTRAHGTLVATPIKTAMDASLAVVDAAINDARTALVRDPRDPFLIDYLDGLQRKRIQVLREFSLRMSDQA